MSKTKERVMHMFPGDGPFERDAHVVYVRQEPMHFLCHLDHCVHAFCREHGGEIRDVVMMQKYGLDINKLPLPRSGNSEVV